MLPDLQYDFSHALVNDVVVGPRREVTLLVQTLSWVDGKGKLGLSVLVGFGGITNFDAVRDFFTQFPRCGSELAWLRY